MMRKTNKTYEWLLIACAVTALAVSVVGDPVLALPKPAPRAAAKKIPAAAPFPLYALDVNNTKVGYTVTLNGFPVDDNPGGTNGHFSSTRVGEYIADGDNIVSIHLYSTNPKFLSGFGVTVRTTGNPKLFDYGWEPEDLKHPLPIQHEGHFTTHLPTGPWAWQTAPKITLDAPTKAAINAQLKRLSDTLNSKNVAESVTLFALLNHDHYLGRGLPVEDAEKDSHDAWTERFASPGWHMYPIDYPHLRYELIAGGRVVQVVRSDGGSPLFNATADPDGHYKGFDVYLCQVHGQWTLIR